MNFIYNDGCEKSDKTEAMEGSIKKFLEKTFGQKCYCLKTIEFLPQNSPCFDCQIEGIAIPEKNKIQLKYESFINTYDEISQEINSQEVLGTLVHETQHLINRKELKTVFSSIKNSDNLGYIKYGMENLLDEYLASYWAFKIVPEGFSGILDCISKIPEDVQQKKANPYKLYLTIIRIIAYFTGETMAIYENSGVDEWSERCQSIADHNFIYILQLAKDAVKRENLEDYLQKGKNVATELLKYVDADFDILKKVDEMEGNSIDIRYTV